jgi:glycosyltransferase involved in cell wall biosynthesis
MNKLSVVIIACNEEKNIGRCLKSVRWADEIVVADSGSTDATMKICLKHGCRVRRTRWLGFSGTRSFAVRQASHDWILSVDADEEVSDGLAAEIRTLLKGRPGCHGYLIPVRSFFLGKLMRHGGWNRESHVRLFDRRRMTYNDKPVHEGVRIQGAKGSLNGVLWHYPYPTLDRYIRKMNQYTELGARSLQIKGEGSSLFRAFLHAAGKFGKMYFIQRGILDGRKGFVLAAVSSISVYFKYLKRWEMNS